MSLAAAATPSSASNGVATTTGPKISSRYTLKEDCTSTSTVGST
ncbi:Uncharacterised protein [Mycobacteroides abscessus subsp. abscessus]|nr:Uncharacterised protein [Mycobacteroides abscessus subsp. abscessus]